MNKKKFWGQNFLNDINIIQFIINIINPKKNETIIEIGPGLGALTNQIAKYINNITVIEIDYNYVNFLQKSEIKNKLNIIHNNVLKVNFFDLLTINSNKLRFIGSIPYSISTSLILKFLNNVDIIFDIYLVLQKEVANRLIANHNSKFYGRLSVLSQYHYKIIPILELYPKNFKPRPKVDSMLVRMIPYKKKPFKLNNFQILENLTNLAFNKRRKMISNSLKSLFSMTEIEYLNINPMLRAENLTISQYCKLANFFQKFCKHI